MTETPDNNPEKNAESNSTPPEPTRSSEREDAAESAPVEIARVDSGVDLSDLDDLDSFHSLVDEIKERLADLADREAELRRREDECERQQELIERGTAPPSSEARFEPPRPTATTAIDAAWERLREREQALDQRSAAIDDKRAKLKSIAEKLETRRAGLEARDADIASQETEIFQHRQAVDQLYQQAALTRDRAAARENEIAEVAQQLAEREKRLKDEAERLETDRRQFRDELQTLDLERKKLAALHIDLPEPTPGEDRAYRTETVSAIPRLTWRRRRVVLAAIVALATGVVWFLFDRPLYHGIAEVRVSTTRGSLTRVAREHADGMLSNKPDPFWSDADTREKWRSARDLHAISTRMLARDGHFEVRLETRDPADAGDPLPQAIGAYAAYLSQLPLEDFRSPQEIGWLERQSSLQDELKRRRTRCDELTVQLADMPHASERAEAQAAFDGALDQFKAVVEELRKQREELTSLESRALPSGEVAPAAYQEALGLDATYQEDLKEFATEARQYRSELAVAMVLLADPLRELRSDVQNLSKTLTEQRDLQPPANVLSVLDQCLRENEDFDGFLAEFSQGWQQRREAVERLKVDEQVVELVNLQTQALEAAGRLTVEARRVFNVLQTRVDSLAEGDNAGTREMVVVSVLRGDLSRLSGRIDALAEPAGAVSPEKNFRLDAHDRQLRGLRTRLQDRQERIRQSLQVEADRTARAERQEREDQLQRTMRAAEEERQGLMQQLVESLQLLRALDERYQELRQTTAELNAEKAAVGRLEERLAQLESERPATQRDKLDVVATRVEPLAGAHRWRDAFFAAVAAFLAAALILFVTGFGAYREYQTVADEST